LELWGGCFCVHCRNFLNTDVGLAI
jgi:hypothetical protein